MQKTNEAIWKLEKLALDQDFFTLEYAAKQLGITPRRAFDLIKYVRRNKILKEYNLPKARGRPTKLYRLALKDLKIDKSKEIFEYVEKIKDKADYITLFGSLTTKFADQYSDIDLFVLSKKEIKKPDNIEVINVNNLDKIPLTTRFNIINNGITLLSKNDIPGFEFDFEEAIKQKEMKIKSDMELLKIAGFPESAAILGMILLNIGYLLMLNQDIVPSCWKEVKIYLATFFKEINLLYSYYLKFQKERNIEDKQLNLNKSEYEIIENGVFELWKRIKQKKFSIPPYIRPAM